MANALPSVGLRLVNLSKRYSPSPSRGRAADPALSGHVGGVTSLSLDVEPGETLVLVGPSGCGKSTTLRLVAGLEVPDEGTIRLGERDLNGVPSKDRDVAMVFQGFALYPHMKARDILGFPLRMRGVRRAERERRVAEVAELLSIERLLERRPGQLSGGERQRVAMGRALVRNPALFLFDEPLSNLDAALRAELRTELGSLLRRLGTTSLYVTHDQVEAMTLGRRIAVVRAGRLEQLGSARELYERPANQFVATFVGQPPMNLIPLDLGAGCLVAGAPLVGFRPEHGSLEGGEVTLPGTVRALEPLGAETHVWVELDGDAPADERRVCVRRAGFGGPSPGERAEVSFSLAALHVFDARSGRRLD